MRKMDVHFVVPYLRPDSVDPKQVVAAGSAVWIKHAEVPEPRWTLMAVYDNRGRGPVVLAHAPIDRSLRRTKVKLDAACPLSGLRAAVFPSLEAIHAWTTFSHHVEGEGDSVPIGDGNGRTAVIVPPADDA